VNRMWIGYLVGFVYAVVLSGLMVCVGPLWSLITVPLMMFIVSKLDDATKGKE